MLTKVLQGDWPLTQDWGPATYGGEPPGHGYRRWHEGVDLGCPTGTICLAPRLLVCNRFGQGYVVLEDSDGIEHFYFHISGSLVGIDDYAADGYPVATSGAEAVAGGIAPTGPHLHYGVRRSPYRYQVDDFDPTPYYQLTFGPDPGEVTDLTPEQDALLTQIATHAAGAYEATYDDGKTGKGFLFNEIAAGFAQTKEALWDDGSGHGFIYNLIKSLTPGAGGDPAVLKALSDLQAAVQKIDSHFTGK